MSARARAGSGVLTAALAAPLLLQVGATHPAGASPVFSVTVRTSGQAAGAPVPVSSLADLRAALSGGDGKSPVDIAVAPGTIAVTGDPLVVARDVNLHGAGRDATTIDGSAVARVIDATKNGSGALTVDGLTIVAGTSATGGGAGIATRGVDLVLHDVAVTGAATEGDGGALEVSGGSVRLDGVDVHDNAAQNGGAAVLAGAAVSIAGSTFRANGASGDGGALLVSYPTAFAVKDTTFADNTASRDGGAVHFEGARTDKNDALSIAATFTGNWAGGSGGALFVGSTSNGRHPVALQLGAATFTGNQAAAAGGGAVALAHGRLEVHDTTFEANQARGDSGPGGALLSRGDLTLSSTTFKDNTADGPGPAVAIDGGSVAGLEQATFPGTTPEAAVWRGGTKRLDSFRTKGKDASADSSEGAGGDDGVPVGAVAGGIALVVVVLGGLVVLRRSRRRRAGRTDHEAVVSDSETDADDSSAVVS